MDDDSNKSKKQLEKFSSTMFEYLNTQEWKQSVFDARAALIYNKIDDPLIKNHTKAVKIIDGDLFINVESPMIANQLSFQSQKIIQIINERMKKKIVKKLRFHVGNVEREKKEEPYIDPTEGIVLNDNEKKEIEKITSVIEDGELRENVSQLFSTVLKRKKKENQRD